MLLIFLLFSNSVLAFSLCLRHFYYKKEQEQIFFCYNPLVVFESSSKSKCRSSNSEDDVIKNLKLKKFKKGIAELLKSLKDLTIDKKILDKINANDISYYENDIFFYFFDDFFEDLKNELENNKFFKKMLFQDLFSFFLDSFFDFVKEKEFFQDYFKIIEYMFKKFLYYFQWLIGVFGKDSWNIDHKKKEDQVKLETEEFVLKEIKKIFDNKVAIFKKELAFEKKEEISNLIGSYIEKIQAILDRSDLKNKKFFRESGKKLQEYLSKISEIKNVDDMGKFMEKIKIFEFFTKIDNKLSEINNQAQPATDQNNQAQPATDEAANENLKEIAENKLKLIMELINILIDFWSSISLKLHAIRKLDEFEETTKISQEEQDLQDLKKFINENFANKESWTNEEMKSFLTKEQEWKEQFLDIIKKQKACAEKYFITEKLQNFFQNKVLENFLKMQAQQTIENEEKAGRSQMKTEENERFTKMLGQFKKTMHSIIKNQNAEIPIESSVKTTPFFPNETTAITCECCGNVSSACKNNASLPAPLQRAMLIESEQKGRATIDQQYQDKIQDLVIKERLALFKLRQFQARTKMIQDEENKRLEIFKDFEEIIMLSYENFTELGLAILDQETKAKAKLEEERRAKKNAKKEAQIERKATKTRINNFINSRKKNFATMLQNANEEKKDLISKYLILLDWFEEILKQESLLEDLKNLENMMINEELVLKIILEELSETEKIKVEENEEFLNICKMFEKMKEKSLIKRAKNLIERAQNENLERKNRIKIEDNEKKEFERLHVKMLTERKKILRKNFEDAETIKKNKIENEEQKEMENLINQKKAIESEQKKRKDVENEEQKEMENLMQWHFFLIEQYVSQKANEIEFKLTCEYNKILGCCYNLLSFMKNMFESFIENLANNLTNGNLVQNMLCFQFLRSKIAIKVKQINFKCALVQMVFFNFKNKFDLSFAFFNQKYSSQIAKLCAIEIMGAIELQKTIVSMHGLYDNLYKFLEVFSPYDSERQIFDSEILKQWLLQ